MAKNEERKETGILLLYKFKDKLYNEQSIIESLLDSGYSHIEVGFSPHPAHHKVDAYTMLKRFNMKQKLYGTPIDVTGFIGVDENNIVQYVWFEKKKLEEIPPPPSDAATFGCLTVLVVVVGLIIWFLVGVFSEIDWDTNDCNDSWIEQDYNGDGEKDAEDYRIQTQGC